MHDKLPVTGVHPLVLRQRTDLSSFKDKADSEMMPLLAGIFLFLSVFAFGLRLVDHHYGTAYRATETQPRHELNGEDFEFLSHGLRTLLGIKTVQAAEFDEVRFKAEPLNRHVIIDAKPGEVVPIELYFRNLGSATWSSEGPGYISAYTTQPRYHAGVLRHESWLSSSQPARLASASVAPGSTGVLSFMAQAPSGPGEYSDWMQLASEDTAWVWGGHVQVTLRVSGTSVSAPSPTPVPLPVPDPVDQPVVAPDSGMPSVILTSNASPHRGSLLLTSTRQIIGEGHRPHEVMVGFKNNGQYAWNTREIKFRGFTKATVTDASFRHGTWASEDTLAVERAGITEPGRIAFMTFTVMTPEKRGDYLLRLGLFVEGREVEGATLDLPITVTSDYAAPSYVAPSPTSPSSQPSLVVEDGIEPEIRIGLYYTEVTREEFVADVPYEVRDANGALLASFQAGAPVQVWYDEPTGSYKLTNGIVNLTSASWLTFQPLSDTGIWTLMSHVDRPSWNPSLNDNRFRGIIEFRRHSSGRVWIINRLPMEQYLWGLAETSNNSPTEFMKALAVAARSYGQWHLTNPGKYDHFTVGALNDQVYKGYGAEVRYPNFVNAVKATAGQIVTYNGEEVITPYYSWSDGRTRAWTEVWGGSHKAWLVSVEAPYDVGRNLFGHGVGMSAWDAIGRANAGASYDIILNHYYSGTALKRKY